MKKRENSRRVLIGVIAVIVAFALCATGCVTHNEPEEKPDLAETAVYHLPSVKGCEWECDQSDELFEVSEEKTDNGIDMSLKAIDTGKCTVTLTLKKGDTEVYRVTDNLQVNQNMAIVFIDHKTEQLDSSVEVTEVSAPSIE